MARERCVQPWSSAAAGTPEGDGAVVSTCMRASAACSRGARRRRAHHCPWPAQRSGRAAQGTRRACAILPRFRQTSQSDHHGATDRPRLNRPALDETFGHARPVPRDSSTAHRPAPPAPRPTQLGKLSQVKSSRVKASQGKSRQVKSRQVKSRQVKASQGKSRHVESSRVNSMQVKSSQGASAYTARHTHWGDQWRSEAIRGHQRRHLQLGTCTRGYKAIEDAVESRLELDGHLGAHTGALPPHRRHLPAHDGALGHQGVV